MTWCVRKVIFLLSMIMNLRNFHFDSVLIFTLFTKRLDMYVCLIMANILNDTLSFFFFILS